MEFRHPAIVLCAYRPPFSLFTSHQLSGLGKSYQEIQLQDLSLSDAQDMMESLLKSKSHSPELRKFIQEKVEGNPFYLEEVINSLIESGTLIRDNGNWRLSRPIDESDISADGTGRHLRQARPAGEGDEAYPSGSLGHREGLSL